jgi:rRNA-processing protein FCF1
MYLKYNSALGPPYQILIDTNFINFSIQNKLDVFKSMMDCLLAKCMRSPACFDLCYPSPLHRRADHH